MSIAVVNGAHERQENWLMHSKNDFGRGVYGCDLHFTVTGDL